MTHNLLATPNPPHLLSPESRIENLSIDRSSVITVVISPPAAESPLLFVRDNKFAPSRHNLHPTVSSNQHDPMEINYSRSSVDGVQLIPYALPRPGELGTNQSDLIIFRPKVARSRGGGGRRHSRKALSWPSRSNGARLSASLDRSRGKE